MTAEVLAKVGATLQRQLELGAWREVKLYLRFLGCLQGMFEGDGIFPVLEELFSRAADLQMKSSEDVSPPVQPKALSCFGADPDTVFGP